MSDISFNVGLKVSKDNLNNVVSVVNATASMTQVGMKSLTLALTTNPASVSTAGLSSVGMAFLRNLSTHTAATAAFGISQGGSFVGLCTLRASEPAIFRLSPGVDYEAIGTSGTRLRVDITEG